MSEKSYRDALEVAVGRAGADSSQLSGWAEALREADDDLNTHIAVEFRAGNTEAAQVYVDRGHELLRCAAFLEKLYADLEGEK